MFLRPHEESALLARIARLGGWAARVNPVPSLSATGAREALMETDDLPRFPEGELAPVIPLPVESCPICLRRIRPKDVTILDRGDTIHAKECWPIVVEMRKR